MSGRRLPRDLGSDELVRAMAKLGYLPTRQSGSHIRVSTQLDGEHHETIPSHDPLKVGTLNAILKGVADHHRLERDQLLEMLGL